MLGPYREPGPVEPDLPTRCTADDLPCIGAPYPPRFPASIGCPRARPRAVLPFFAKALSASATLFLLVASASLSAITYSVIVQQARRAQPHAVPQTAEPPVQVVTRAEPPQMRTPWEPPPSETLSVAGKPTHDVEELWSRARALEAIGHPISLERRTLPGAISPWTDAGALRVAPEHHKGWSGLRVRAVPDGSAPGLAGVRAGDLVMAVNGYRLAAPEDVNRAFTALKQDCRAIVELHRLRRRVVLYVDWCPKAG